MSDDDIIWFIFNKNNGKNCNIGGMYQPMCYIETPRS